MPNLARYVAALLTEDAVFKKRFKKYYDVRSHIVHGDKDKAKIILEKNDLSNEDFHTVVKDLMVQACHHGWNPRKSKKSIHKLLKPEKGIIESLRQFWAKFKK